jgi:hypothetical protein
MPIGVTIPTTFTAINRFSSPVRAMENSMKGFIGRSRAGMASLETGFRRALGPLTALQNTMRGLGLYIGLFSVLMVARSALGILADFEKAQLNIQSVSPKTASQNKLLALQARQMAVDYGIAATSVSALQYELIKMGFADKKGGMQNVIDMTPSIVLGAKAMGAPEDQLAKMVGASMNLFKLPANDVVDLFAKGLDLSALDFESFSHMLRNSQQAWSLAGKDLPSLVSHLAILSNSFVHSASAGTGLKNITLDNAVAMKTLESQLLKMANSKNPLVAGKNMYGRKAVLAAFPLAAAMEDGSLQTLLDKLNGTYKGYTEDLNKIKMQGITYKWDQAKAAWQELILGIDDGTGPLAKSVRQWIDVGRAMFLVQSGTSVANEALGKMDSTVVALANKYLMWLKVAGWLIISLLAIKTTMLVLNGILMIGRAAWAIYSFTMGIAAAMGIRNAWALRGNAIALGTLRLATNAATLATRLLNGTLISSPWGWAILGLGLVAAYLWNTSKAYDGVTESAKKANAEQDRIKAVHDNKPMKTNDDLIMEQMKKRSDETAFLMKDFWRSPVSSIANVIKRDISEDFSRVKSMFTPDLSPVGLDNFNLNDARQQDMMHQYQMQPINGSVHVKLGNVPPGTTAKTSGPVSFQPESTYHSYQQD